MASRSWAGMLGRQVKHDPRGAVGLADAAHGLGDVGVVNPGADQHDGIAAAAYLAQCHGGRVGGCGKREPA
jgi:hypothetical protein